MMKIKENIIKLFGEKVNTFNILLNNKKTSITCIKLLPHFLIEKKNKINLNELLISCNFNIKEKNKSIIEKFNKKNLYVLKNTTKWLLKIDETTKRLFIRKKLHLHNLFKITKKNITIKIKSIGKGFTGTIKKHNFKRGPKSHGSNSYRRIGSIGSGRTLRRILPGKKMPGHLGNKIITKKNMKIFNIDNNLIYIKGILAGKNNSKLEIEIKI